MVVPADQFERLRAALAPRYRVLREVGHGGMARSTSPRISSTSGGWPSRSCAPSWRRRSGRTASCARSRSPPFSRTLTSFRCTTPAKPTVSSTTSCPTSRARRCAIGWSASASCPSRRRSASRKRSADGLAYAHGLGIVHRDIKPENILFMGGHAVIADFGVASAVGLAGGTRLTQSGFSVGTPVYMSPEQALGQGEVGRSQRHLLAGLCAVRDARRRSAVRGPSPQAVVARKLQRGRVADCRPTGTVSPGLEEAVRRALAKVAGGPVRHRGGVRPGD